MLDNLVCHAHSILCVRRARTTNLQNYFKEIFKNCYTQKFRPLKIYFLLDCSISPFTPSRFLPLSSLLPPYPTLPSLPSPSPGLPVSLCQIVFFRPFKGMTLFFSFFVAVSSQICNNIYGLENRSQYSATPLWAYGKAGNGNEMETGNGNRKLKTEMETQPLSSRSPSKIQLLLVFVPRHPSAVPASSF